jgi:mercuric ion transport protein
MEMNEARMSDRNPTVAGDAAVMGRARSGADGQTKKTIFAGGSVIGAVAMSSCCILPLVLFSLGATGAWIGSLAALYPYKWIFLSITAGFLAGGFYLVYRKPRTSASAPGTCCASPLSNRINKTVLWAATVLALAAAAFPYVAPAFLES